MEQITIKTNSLKDAKIMLSFLQTMSIVRDLESNNKVISNLYELNKKNIEFEIKYKMTFDEYEAFVLKKKIIH